MEAPFYFVTYHYLRNVVAMHYVLNPKTKMYRPKSKVPFNGDELSLQILRELISIFAPQKSAVIDSVSGFRSTTIARIHVNKKCACIEKEATYFTSTVQS